MGIPNHELEGFARQLLQGGRLQIIYGSPGCGKTSTLIDRITDAARNRGFGGVAISHTNAAIEEIRRRSGAGHNLAVMSLHQLARQALDASRRDDIRKLWNGLAGWKGGGGTPRRKPRQTPHYKIEVRDFFPILGLMAAHGNFTMEWYQSPENADYHSIFGREVDPSRATLFADRLRRFIEDPPEKSKDWNWIFRHVDGSLINGYSHIFVDEAQDLKPVQIRFLLQATVCHPSRRLIIAGDPDQCLYWRDGSDPDWMLRLHHAVRRLSPTSSSLTLLSESRRCGSTIMDRAASVIRPVWEQRAQLLGSRSSIPSLTAEVDGGVVIDMTHHQLLETVDIRLLDQWWESDSSVMLLVPYHAQANGYRALLRPLYPTDCEALVERFLAVDALPAGDRGWSLKHLYDDHELDCIQQTIIAHDYPPGHVFEEWPAHLSPSCGAIWRHRDRLRQRAKALHIPRRLPDQQGKHDQISLRVETIHSAKGSEADVVIVAGVQAMYAWTSLGETTDYERRSIRYVAYSRARSHLYVFGGTERVFQSIKVRPGVINTE